MLDNAIATSAVEEGYIRNNKRDVCTDIFMKCFCQLTYVTSNVQTVIFYYNMIFFATAILTFLLSTTVVVISTVVILQWKAGIFKN